MFDFIAHAYTFLSLVFYNSYLEFKKKIKVLKLADFLIFLKLFFFCKPMNK